MPYIGPATERAHAIWRVYSKKNKEGPRVSELGEETGGKQKKGHLGPECMRRGDKDDLLGSLLGREYFALRS